MDHGRQFFLFFLSLNGKENVTAGDEFTQATVDPANSNSMVSCVKLAIPEDQMFIRSNRHLEHIDDDP